jgi:hypothetical protein
MEGTHARFWESENLISPVVKELPKGEANKSIIFKDDYTTSHG